MGRFKDLLQDYSNHQQFDEVLSHTFVEALNHITKFLVNSDVGGQVLELTYDDVYTLLNWIVQGNHERLRDSKSSTKNVAGVLEVDKFNFIFAQISAQQN